MHELLSTCRIEQVVLDRLFLLQLLSSNSWISNMFLFLSPGMSSVVGVIDRRQALGQVGHS